MEGPRYLASTAVVMSEISKVVTCLVIVLYESYWNFHKATDLLKSEIVLNKIETIKTSVPAALYTIQNNLLFVALSNLDAATFQVQRLYYVDLINPLCCDYIIGASTLVCQNYQLQSLYT